MKTLIIFYHPYEGSYCNAILTAVKDGLERSGQPHKTIDLGKDEFDPVMRAKDLSAFANMGRLGEAALDDLDTHVLRYKKKLEWAERIVMIFPIWWMTAPAMVKGFIDKVIFPGVAYNMDGPQLKSRLHSLRQVTIITTMNTPADVYRDQFNNAIEEISGRFGR